MNRNWGEGPRRRTHVGAYSIRLPEHFTASIVGHQSARSENRMTYGIYSAGISDEQKREIVQKVGLPCP